MVRCCHAIATAASSSGCEDCVEMGKWEEGVVGVLEGRRGRAEDGAA